MTRSCDRRYLFLTVLYLSNLGIFCFICYVNVSRSSFRIQTPVGIGNRRRSGKKLKVTRGIKSCTHQLNDDITITAKKHSPSMKL